MITPLPPRLAEVGLRFGDRGTHTSRTIMLTELSDLLAGVPGGSERRAYEAAVVDDNVLGKPTAATRRSTFQRLSELYALDPFVPAFRVLRRVWDVDEDGRPLIALLCALARDPLLRSTTGIVLALNPDAELIRGDLLQALRTAAGDRLNEAVLEKVARNVSSSWSQAGHLRGRVRKIRHLVTPTRGATAFALWLGSLEGLAGDALLDSRWTRVLDRSGVALLPMVFEAKQFGLIHARAGGGVVEIDAAQLDPHGTRS